jgi:hypothetical protein
MKCPIPQACQWIIAMLAEGITHRGSTARAIRPALQAQIESHLSER